MDRSTTTPPNPSAGGDPLALRRRALASHTHVTLAPLLELVDDLQRDAKRQYDLTAATVLMRTRELIVERLEQAVDCDRWISVSDAAERTRRPEGTIRYWCRTGKVRARRVGARAWEVDAQSLYRYDEAA
jgi:hypothetical protein